MGLALVEQAWPVVAGEQHRGGIGAAFADDGGHVDRFPAVAADARARFCLMWLSAVLAHRGVVHVGEVGFGPRPSGLGERGPVDDGLPDAPADDPVVTGAGEPRYDVAEDGLLGFAGGDAFADELGDVGFGPAVGMAAGLLEQRAAAAVPAAGLADELGQLPRRVPGCQPGQVGWLDPPVDARLARCLAFADGGGEEREPVAFAAVAEPGFDVDAGQHIVM